jgi:hypothetical protein
MRRTLVVPILALLAALVVAAPALAEALRPVQLGGAYPIRARVWVENDRDYYRSGDRLQVRFTTSSDAYVAVIHIDSQGYLDFLYPANPWDDEYVQGGRVYSLPRGFGNGAIVRGSRGIGYLYIIASPVPLDYRAFRHGGSYGWDWSYAGRDVRGDPFWAFEQLTRLLVPDYGYVPYATDYYSYYVGGYSRYPAYACADGWSRRGWGWSPYADSCSRLDLFLRRNPYYFDARRYRGDRRVYFRTYPDYNRPVERHRYKEDPSAPPRSSATARPRYDAPPPRESPRAEDPARPAERSGGRASEPQRPAARPAERQKPESAPPRQEEPRPAERRPTLERRPREPEAAPPPRQAERPQESRPAARARPHGESGSRR